MLWFVSILRSTSLGGKGACSGHTSLGMDSLRGILRTEVWLDERLQRISINVDQWVGYLLAEDRRVRVFHSQGSSPTEIARKTTLSEKHIRRIIKQQEDATISNPTARHKIYESVPEDIIEMVQRYVEGLIYVPSSTSRVARRHTRIKRLLREGHTTAEIANRTGMSERRIWQLKAEYKEEIKNKKQTVKKQITPDRPIPDILNVTVVESTEPTETHPRKCNICGNLFEPHESSCIICGIQSKKEKSDSDIIVVSRLPYAIIDRDF
ncbi:MAG: hypothetical protein ACYC27_16460 [Armatimonadota bacterium]